MESLRETDRPKSGKPRGRPFLKGYDPRRSTGSAPNVMTLALRELVAEGRELGIDDLKAIWRTGFARAKAGDLGWATLIAAYLDGRPVARQESGGPGDFARPDLSGFSTEELREFIHAVRKDRVGDKDKENE